MDNDRVDLFSDTQCTLDDDSILVIYNCVPVNLYTVIMFTILVLPTSLAVLLN